MGQDVAVTPAVVGSLVSVAQATTAAGSCPHCSGCSGDTAIRQSIARKGCSEKLFERFCLLCFVLSH